MDIRYHGFAFDIFWEANTLIHQNRHIVLPHEDGIETFAIDTECLYMEPTSAYSAPVVASFAKKEKEFYVCGLPSSELLDSRTVITERYGDYELRVVAVNNVYICPHCGRASAEYTDSMHRICEASGIDEPYLFSHHYLDRRDITYRTYMQLIGLFNKRKDMHVRRRVLSRCHQCARSSPYQRIEQAYLNTTRRDYRTGKYINDDTLYEFLKLKMWKKYDRGDITESDIKHTAARWLRRRRKKRVDDSTRTFFQVLLGVSKFNQIMEGKEEHEYSCN